MDDAFNGCVNSAPHASHDLIGPPPWGVIYARCPGIPYRIVFEGGAYFHTWTPPDPPCDCGEDTCARIEECCRHSGVACSIDCTAVNPWPGDDVDEVEVQFDQPLVTRDDA